MLPLAINELLHAGTVIPAHPLALDRSLRIDEARQRQLTQYYLDSGAGGVAVGVHTTQFEIRDPEVGLYEPVLSLAAEEIRKRNLDQPFIQVAGICGPVEQACREAGIARKYGYHLGLLSMGGLAELSEEALLDRTRLVASTIPVFGFYLQPAVGGRVLSYDFWREFADIPGVKAIKVAAFNRYQTLDVVRAVCNSSRRDDIALYTGNDDNIVADLLTPYAFTVNGQAVTKRFVGGLLGHWAVWTASAVALLQQIKQSLRSDNGNLPELLELGTKITDMNAALFDAKHRFKGSIAGIHEVLRRTGLLEGIWCLSPEERLSPGQIDEIDRVMAAYPSLTV